MNTRELCRYFLVPASCERSLICNKNCLKLVNHSNSRIEVPNFNSLQFFSLENTSLSDDTFVPRSTHLTQEYLITTLATLCTSPPNVEHIVPCLIDNLTKWSRSKYILILLRLFPRLFSNSVILHKIKTNEISTETTEWRLTRSPTLCRQFLSAPLKFMSSRMSPRASHRRHPTPSIRHRGKFLRQF